jgi:hypothetical protein
LDHVPEKSYLDIRVEECDLTDEHCEWLENTGLNIVRTTQFMMFPISGADFIYYGDSGGITISNIHNKNYTGSVAFAFKYKENSVHYPKCKIYTPGQVPKMIGNTNRDNIFCSDLPPFNCEEVLISAGQKDTMFLNHILQTNSLRLQKAICANSENVILDFEELRHDMPFLKNRRDVFVLLDNDEAGRKASEKYHHMGYSVISESFWTKIINEINRDFLFTGKDIGDIYTTLIKQSMFTNPANISHFLFTTLKSVYENIKQFNQSFR